MFAKTNRSIVWVMIITLVGILLFSALPALAYGLPVNVAGREVSLGRNCDLDSNPATPDVCGVTFVGWTTNSSSWVKLPGNGQGLSNVTVNYSGKADFGKVVYLKGGSYAIVFKAGTKLSGKITGGQVAWPDKGSDSGCGTNVGVVDAQLSGSATTFKGCLHDLPLFTVIPPKIWGVFQ